MMRKAVTYMFVLYKQALGEWSHRESMQHEKNVTKNIKQFCFSHADSNACHNDSLWGK